ncbi:hypothetical protein Tco_1433275 [Tanacetum coccineum]
MDGKKIIITESIVKRDLQLEDAEGVDCLPNTTIFEQLTLMGSKTTAWNKFSSTMAFAIIFLEKQRERMSNHKRIYVTPTHTKKIFGNMRRVGKGFFGRETPLFPIMMVQAQEEMGEDTSAKEKGHSDTSVYKELDDNLVRVATTASSLEAEQDNGNIAKTQSKATPNESSSIGTTSGGGPRRQETIRDTIAQIRFENVSKHSNDPLLARGNTLRSGEDSLKLNELMELCTNLQTRVLYFEKTKTTQAEEIVSLKRRVKKLEQKKRSRTHRLKRLHKVGLTARVESSRDEESLGEDASKQGRINAIDADKDITLVNDQDDADMFDVNTLTALAALKSVKSKVKGDVIEEPSVPASAASTKAKVQDKEKMIEPKKPLKKKYQISFDEQEAIRLQAEFDKDKRHTKEKDKANVALTKEWDDIQAKVNANYQLAQRLKHFAAKRAEEKRNKPPTKTQQKKTMITYLKNMEGWKHKDLKCGTP